MREEKYVLFFIKSYRTNRTHLQENISDKKANVIQGLNREFSPRS